MKAIEKVGNVVDKAFAKTDQLVPFGKAERITAGVCMGIPFFLLLTDKEYQDRAWWWFIALSLFFLCVPFIIAYVARVAKIKERNHGIFITSMFGIILIGLYVFFTRLLKFESLDSISAYVTIEDSFIFGLLLMIAVMLFITNGLVYWEEYRRGSGIAGRWRAYGNVILGIALAGVVLFPYHRWACLLHYISAVTFFVGCAVATVFRAKKRKEHAAIDFAIAGIMALGFTILAVKSLLHLSGWFVDLFNLFGAESVGLWVIGVDFILV